MSYVGHPYPTTAVAATQASRVAGVRYQYGLGAPYSLEPSAVMRASARSAEARRLGLHMRRVPRVVHLGRGVTLRSLGSCYSDETLSGLFSFVGKAIKGVGHVIGKAAKGVAKGAAFVGRNVGKGALAVGKTALKVAPYAAIAAGSYFAAPLAGKLISKGGGLIGKLFGGGHPKALPPAPVQAPPTFDPTGIRRAISLALGPGTPQPAPVPAYEAPPPPMPQPVMDMPLPAGGGGSAGATQTPLATTDQGGEVYQQAPAEAGMPSWLLPVALGGAVLLLGRRR